MDCKEYTNFIFKAMTPVLKNILYEKIKTYDLDFVKTFEYREKGILKGLLIYFDDENTRWILEGVNMSNKGSIFVKYFKKMLQDKNIKIFKVIVQRLNKRVLNFYLKIGFSIIEENNINIALEYRR